MTCAGASLAAQSSYPIQPRTTKSGKGISLEFTIIPLRSETGELLGLAAIMRDVTKRFEEKRALERKLAEAVKEPR